MSVFIHPKPTRARGLWWPMAELLSGNTTKVFNQRFEASLSTVRKLINVVTDRIEVEEFFRKSTCDASTEEVGTMKDFWKTFHDYHVQELKNREAFYDVLVNVVLKRLKEVEGYMLEEKKMITLEITKLEKGLDVQYKSLLKYKAQLVSLTQEIETEKNATEKATMKAKNLAKINARLETREEQFNKSKLSFDKAAEEFKAHSERYVEGMSKVFENFIQLESRRISTIKDIVQVYVLAQMKSSSASTGSNSVLKAISLIDSRVDNYPLTLIPVDDPISNNPHIFDLDINYNINFKSSKASEPEPAPEDQNLDNHKENKSPQKVLNVHDMKGRNAVALYDYTARSPQELSFTRGQVLSHVIGPEVGKRLGIILPRFWLEGELNGKKGLIPANYVEVLYTEESIKLVVESRFIANNNQELSIIPKEELTLISTCGDGWYRAKNHVGNVGLLPLTHVRVVPGQ
eukprot:TRINITY_DN2625_c0_g1_i1.p1 TRINITY_DN2625_c0_g1~~TRINITY_DN2625_c0_g1_i1.p1  ORF type:complete len:460 (-),score=59.69 TRINITY_DN2625_c0_g1_i1:29-1408(-)